MAVLAWSIGTPEMVVVGVAAVLIFGRRLPEVGRYLGKGLLEFKESLRGTKKDLGDVSKAVENTDRDSEEPDRDREKPGKDREEPGT